MLRQSYEKTRAEQKEFILFFFSLARFGRNIYFCDPIAIPHETYRN